MADSKISALPSSTTPLAGTEVLPIVQSSTTVKVAVSDLTAGRAVSAASLSLTTTPLAVASGGTGLATVTANRIPYGNGTSALNNSANLIFDGTILTATTGANFATTSGSVGVGVSSPSASLDIQGTQINFDTNVYASVRVRDTTAYNSTPRAGIVFSVKYNAGGTYGVGSSIQGYKENSNDGDFGQGLLFTVQENAAAPAERMRIASNGIVTMSAYGAGAATFSAAGVISSVSDENWKIKDGVPTNPTEMLKKLEPGYWYYNDKYKDTFGVDRQLGFYAQNVNAAIGPEAAPEPESNITTDENGNEITQQKPWGYYDRSVLAVVVMALKDAMESIEALKIRLTALENR